jgi:malate/lactate dehydrogenase
VKALCVGALCTVGAGRTERVIEVELEAVERKLFDASVERSQL